MRLPTSNNVSKLDYLPHSPALDPNHFSISKMKTQPTKTFKIILQKPRFAPNEDVQKGLQKRTSKHI